MDFAVAVSSWAVRISSRAVRVFPALSLRPHTEAFLLWFSKEISTGGGGGGVCESYDKMTYFGEFGYLNSSCILEKKFYFNFEFLER